jgi:hypothetical protein
MLKFLFFLFLIYTNKSYELIQINNIEEEGGETELDFNISNIPLEVNYEIKQVENIEEVIEILQKLKLNQKNNLNEDISIIIYDEDGNNIDLETLKEKYKNDNHNNNIFNNKNEYLEDVIIKGNLIIEGELIFQNKKKNLETTIKTDDHHINNIQQQYLSPTKNIIEQKDYQKNCHIRMNSCNLCNFISLNCESNEILTSGGCSSEDNPFIQNSPSLDGNYWNCKTKIISDKIEIFIICCIF